MIRINFLAAVAVSVCCAGAAFAHSASVQTAIGTASHAQNNYAVTGKSAGGITSIGTGRYGVTTDMAGTSTGSTYLSSTPDNTPTNSPAS